MLSPSWPKCVAQLAVAKLDCRQLSVAQQVCRPDDRTPTRMEYGTAFTLQSLQSTLLAYR